MKSTTPIKFEIGQKVLTPEGEGIIISIKGNKFKVKLTSGMEGLFSEDKIADDSDAG
ncbi:MAG: hypothetical protein HOP08_20490 [Cyclobacteriaceae bacterium]|nr:hypothetical protein [Cyclobacteriaceae bacterium]